MHSFGSYSGFAGGGQGSKPWPSDQWSDRATIWAHLNLIGAALTGNNVATATQSASDEGEASQVGQLWSLTSWPRWASGSIQQAEQPDH